MQRVSDECLALDEVAAAGIDVDPATRVENRLALALIRYGCVPTTRPTNRRTPSLLRMYDPVDWTANHLFARVMKRVLLAHPGTDLRHRSLHVGYVETPPPLGCVILGNLLRAHFPDIAIRVFDGNRSSVQTIERALTDDDYDFVGLTDWFTNHFNCLEVAKYAKQVNPRTMVVLGGPNAGHLAKQILHNRPHVDYVVTDDGEEAILGLVGGIPPTRIPNLHFRDDDGHPRFTFSSSARLWTQPLIDFDFEDLTASLEPYDARRSSYTPEFLTPFPTSFVRGCIKAVTSGRCSFCSIPGSSVRLTEPTRVWEQIRLLKRRYGIEYYFETGDDFVVGTYPDMLLRAKPADLDVRLRVYTQPTSVTAARLHTLRALGVSDMFIGTENTSAEILSKANKPYDCDSLDSMLDLLDTHSIRPHITFLLGLPGETTATARFTYERATSIARRYRESLKRVLYCLAIPIVGSDWFRDLAARSNVQNRYRTSVGRELLDDDDIAYSALVRLSVEAACSIEWEELMFHLQTGQNELQQIVGLHRLTSFGSAPSTDLPSVDTRSWDNEQADYQRCRNNK